MERGVATSQVVVNQPLRLALCGKTNYYLQIQKGIGRAALELAITEIRQIEGIKKIQNCYHPDNEIAKRLYFKIGFHEVGMDESGEDMWAELSV